MLIHLLLRLNGLHLFCCIANRRLIFWWIGDSKRALLGDITLILGENGERALVIAFPVSVPVPIFSVVGVLLTFTVFLSMLWCGGVWRYALVSLSVSTWVCVCVCVRGNLSMSGDLAALCVVCRVAANGSTLLLVFRMILTTCGTCGTCDCTCDCGCCCCWWIA